MINIENAKTTLSGLKQCAIEAGIYDYWFVSFGTLLGAIRPSKRIIGKDVSCVKGFIQHDDDMDVGIFHDLITSEQEEKYVQLVKEAGFFKEREKHEYRTGTDKRHAWMSVRREPPPNGTKCCHWFWFLHDGRFWHSKGKAWASKGKFPELKDESMDAVALGVPFGCLEYMQEIDIDGEKFNAPARYGEIIDFWYNKDTHPWIIPKTGGASSHKEVLIVPKWEESQNWYRL